MARSGDTLGTPEALSPPQTNHSSPLAPAPAGTPGAVPENPATPDLSIPCPWPVMPPLATLTSVPHSTPRIHPKVLPTARAPGSKAMAWVSRTPEQPPSPMCSHQDSTPLPTTVRGFRNKTQRPSQPEDPQHKREVCSTAPTSLPLRLRGATLCHNRLPQAPGASGLPRSHPPGRGSSPPPPAHHILLWLGAQHGRLGAGGHHSAMVWRRQDRLPGAGSAGRGPRPGGS